MQGEHCIRGRERIVMGGKGGTFTRGERSCVRGRKVLVGTEGGRGLY